MKFLYIPAHFLAALKAAGLSVDNGGSVEQLTDVRFLADILSPDDVAFYWYLNVPGNGVMPNPITASLQPAVQAVSNPPADDTENPKLRQIINRFTDYSLNKSAPFIEIEGKTLTCALLDDEVVVFSHIDSDAVNEQDTYDRIINVLHTVMPFEQLAETPLFHQYLTLTQQQQ